MLMRSHSCGYLAACMCVIHSIPQKRVTLEIHNDPSTKKFHSPLHHFPSISREQKSDHYHFKASDEIRSLRKRSKECFTLQSSDKKILLGALAWFGALSLKYVDDCYNLPDRIAPCSAFSFDPFLSCSRRRTTSLLLFAT